MNVGNNYVSTAALLLVSDQHLNIMKLLWRGITSSVFPGKWWAHVVCVTPVWVTEALCVSGWDHQRTAAQRGEMHSEGAGENNRSFPESLDPPQDCPHPPSITGPVLISSPLSPLVCAAFPQQSSGSEVITALLLTTLKVLFHSLKFFFFSFYI